MPPLVCCLPCLPWGRNGLSIHYAQCLPMLRWAAAGAAQCLYVCKRSLQRLTRDQIHSHRICTMVQVCVAVHTRRSLFLVKMGLDAHGKQAGDMSAPCASSLSLGRNWMHGDEDKKATAPHNVGIAKVTLTPNSLGESGY